MALRSLTTLDEFGDAVWRADAMAQTASVAGVALDAQLPGGVCCCQPCARCPQRARPRKCVSITRPSA